MANRIKGITVEIGGDTIKLSKALEGVNKNIKNTQTQLKDVQKLLKLDPSNTELLSQKHKLLADAVKATKEKLEILKAAAEQANQALANGEIIETEQELQNLQREAEASGTALAKLGQAGEMLEKAGDKIANVGKTLTTHVTVPVMAAGTAAVSGATSDERLSDYESSLRNIFTKAIKINQSDLSGRKNIKIKPSKLCILCTQVHNMRWLSNPASTVFMGYILKNDHPEYNSLLEGFAPLRPRLKNERKSDIIDNENGRILRFWRFVYECKK